MKYNLLFVILFFTSSLNSQNYDKSKKIDFVTLSLYNPTASLAPRWNIGFVKSIYNRFSVGSEFGYGSQKLNSKTNPELSKEFKIYEIRPEFFYTILSNHRTKQLISMEFFYINHNDKLTNTYFYDSKTDLYTYFESANYKRIKKGLNLNYNFYYPIYKKLYIMSKIGIGVKERNVSIYNLDVTKFQTSENLKEYFLVPELGFDYYRTNIGTDINFNFNLDLKIAHKF